MEEFALSYRTVLQRHQRISGVIPVVVMATVAVQLVAGCSTPSTPPAGPASVSFGPDVSTTPGMVGAGPTGSAAMSTAPMPGMAGPAGSTAPAAPEAPAAPNAVNISNFAFAPVSLTVPVGTTVTWTNKDEEPHTVVSNDGSTFHSPGLGTDQTYSYTFAKPGTFDYTCSIHPFMHGTVEVTK
jgi:plastocyanin